MEPAQFDNTPCRSKDLRPELSLPGKLINCLHMHKIQTLRHFKLSWPRCKCLQETQNGRANEAKSLRASSKETLSNTTPSPYSCKNLKWWHLRKLPVASHCTHSRPTAVLAEARHQQRKGDATESSVKNTSVWEHQDSGEATDSSDTIVAWSGRSVSRIWCCLQFLWGSLLSHEEKCISIAQ